MSKSRISVALAAVHLAFAVPLSAAGNIVPAPPSVAAPVNVLVPPPPAAVEITVDPAAKAVPPVVCESVPDYVAPEYFWYMRAMLTLDCVDAMAERELKLADPNSESEGGTVAIPREVLERLRELALIAKDAAARILR